ncbi:DNRLRE domain-containing protein, partial [Chryseosolibacter indicus]
MNRCLIAITLKFFLLSHIAFGQQVVTISGSDIKDAMLYNVARPGYEYTRDANYGTYARIPAIAWTNSSYPSYSRALLSFNLNSIAPGSIVQSAKLYLYSDPTVTNGGDVNGNSQLDGSNAVYLEKAIGSWDQNTVTWNSQPLTTTLNRIWVGPSTSTTENIEINLTAMVQDWVNNPTSNYGLKMLLENEAHYRSRNYASTNHTNAAIRPKLVVQYLLPAPPTPVVSGPGSVCVTTTGSIYTTASGMSNYVWNVQGGVITSGGTTTSNSVTVTWNTIGSHTVSVIYTDNYGRTATSPGSQIVKVSGPPTVSEPVGVCSGSTGNVYTTEMGMS